ncbi:Alpha-endosulfine, partial [Galemys pyrenaicus]
MEGVRAGEPGASVMGRETVSHQCGLVAMVSGSAGVGHFLRHAGAVAFLIGQRAPRSTHRGCAGPVVPELGCVVGCGGGGAAPERGPSPRAPEGRRDVSGGAAWSDDEGLAEGGNFLGRPSLWVDTQEKEGILPERAEEAKLKAKYPSLGQKPGGSDFLMKRLQKGVWVPLSYLGAKGQKYFDSGDYNMAKAKMKNKQLPSAGPDKNLVTGDHIPTPQDLPQRKSSLVTSKLA